MSHKTLLWSGVCLLLIVQFCAVWWLTPASFFISDEITYFLMAHSMAEEGSLHLWNGYNEYPSLSLILPQTSPLYEQIYPKYPSLYAFIAAPFYMTFGFKGLFLLNALALVGIIWLTQRITHMLFDSVATGWLAAGILLFGTYIWPQSQAIWPHITVIFFILAACYAVVKAWMLPVENAAYPLLAGLCFAIALAIRLDSILIAPLLAAPFLYVRPIRWNALLAIGMISFLGVIFLAVTNFSKFGSLMPLDYGHTIGVRIEGKDFTRLSPSFLVPLAVYAFVFFSSFIWIKGQNTSWHKRVSLNHYAAIWILGAITLCALFWPQTRLALLGFEDIIWNLQKQGGSIQSARSTMSYTESGVYLYSGEMKRAFVQSCPFIFIGLIPFFLRKHIKSEHRIKLCWVWAGAAMYMVFYGTLKWDGGYGYNMRYLLPALPFIAIAAAFSLHQLWQLWRITLKKTDVLLALIAGLCVVAVVLWLREQELQQRIEVLQTGAMLAAIGVCVMLTLAHKIAVLRRFALIVATASVAWGGATAMLLHYPLYQERRAVTLKNAEEMRTTLASDAMYIGPQWQVSMQPVWGNKIRVLNTFLQDDKEIEAVIKQHLAWGVAVYVAPNHAQDLIRKLARWELHSVRMPNGIIEIKSGAPS